MGTKNLEKLISIVGHLKTISFGSSSQADEAYTAWQDAQEELEDLKAALKPFAEFARKFDAQPLRGIADEFYGIHAGTQYEANLKISDCRAALKALGEEQ